MSPHHKNATESEHLKQLYIYIYIYIYIYTHIYGTSTIQLLILYLKIHVTKEALNDLYSSPNIVRVIKSRRMRWVGHVARMGEERGV